jgi:spore coat protein U-like protein
MSRGGRVSAGLRRLLLAAALLAAGQGASAAVTCSVSTVSVAFGVYNPLATAATTSAGSITVSCTSTNNGTTTVNIRAAYGTGSSGTYAARTMRSGSSVLSYNLYFDAAYTQVRGDGTGGTTAGSATLSLGRNQTRSASGTLYGRMPAGQDVAPGTYADAIVVTVTY